MSENSKENVISFQSIPGELFTFYILRNLTHFDILKRVCFVNKFLKECCFSDVLWKFFLNKYSFNEFVKIKKKSMFLDRFKELHFYWRVKKKKKLISNFKLKMNNMHIFCKKTWRLGKKDTLIHSERFFFKENAFFRMKYLTSNLSGCFVGIREKDSGKVHNNYHSDGCISLSKFFRDEGKQMKLENRVQLVNTSKNPDKEKKEKLKVFYPIERNAVLNIFVNYEENLIYYFVGNDFRKNICVSVPKELFKEKLEFVLGLNKNQEVIILPNLKFEMENNFENVKYYAVKKM